MALRVIGAGFPRTGTMSLKAALERLLGGPCYHTSELFEHLEHTPLWRDALRGRTPDWETLFSGFVAGVDWPVGRFWRELTDRYPDALVLLSRRDTADTWHRSMDATVLRERRRVLRTGTDVDVGDEELAAAERPAWAERATLEQARALLEVFDLMNGTAFPDPDDRDALLASYERHLDEVRATVPPSRLLEWQPGDGWPPLCGALGLPIPDEPFPYENTTPAYEARRRDLSGD